MGLARISIGKASNFIALVMALRWWSRFCLEARPEPTLVRMGGDENHLATCVFHQLVYEYKNIRTIPLLVESIVRSSALFSSANCIQQTNVR